MPLIKFRGSVRPVIVAGTKVFVEKALRDAEPYQLALRKRGVSGRATGQQRSCHATPCMVLCGHAASVAG